MNWNKRSFLCIYKNLGKYSALFFLMLILGTIIIGGIIAHQAASNTVLNLRKRMPTLVTLNHQIPNTDELDFELHDLYIQNVVYRLAQHPAIYSYNYYNSINGVAFSKYLRRYRCKIVEQEWLQFQRDMNLNLIRKEPEIGFGYLGHNIVGFSNPEILYVEKGEIEIIAGRSFNIYDTTKHGYSNYSVAVVSKTFAEYNNIWIGDEISFSVNPSEHNGFYFTKSEIPENFMFEIIGIWDFMEKPILTGRDERQTISLGVVQTFFENQILTPYWIVRNMHLQLQNMKSEFFSPGVISLGRINVDFILKDPLFLQDFMSYANDIISEIYIPHMTTFSNHSEKFSAIAISTAQITDLTFTVIIASILIGIIILSLVINLFFNDRKKEFGIYLSLGSKKKHILLQYLFEICLVFLIALTCSLVIGERIANKASHSLLVREMQNYEPDRYTSTVGSLEIRFGFQQLSPDDMLTGFETGLSLSDVFIFTGLGFAVIILSTIIPVLYLLRLKPKYLLEQL